MDIERLKKLIEQREAIDAEIVAAVGGTVKRERATQKCGVCGSSEHNARNCPQKKDPA